MKLHRPWMILALSLTGLALATWVRTPRPAAGQDRKPPTGAKAPAAEPDTPFSGKVLLVQKKLDPSPPVVDLPELDAGLSGFVIQNAGFSEIGGTRFLTGQGLETEDGRPTGPRILVAMDSIGAILEFESVAAYSKYEEQQLEKLSRLRGMVEDWEVMPPPPNGPGRRPDDGEGPDV